MAIKRWLEGTARGASFMTLAISTAWVSSRMMLGPLHSNLTSLEYSI